MTTNMMILRSVVEGEETWIAVIGNTSIRMQFAGATTEAQFANVQALSSAMKINSSQVRLQANKIFNDPGDGLEPQEVIGNMLDMSNRLWLNSEPVWTSLDGTTMEKSDNLLEAAEELAEALA